MATRTERVVLKLDDQFTSGMAKAAAATALLNRNLGDLDGTNVDTTTSTVAATKRTKEYTLEMALAEETSSRFRKSLRDQAKAQLDAASAVNANADSVKRLDADMRRTDNGINQLTGRLRLMADAAVTLGPALIPIGGVGVAAVAGLASQASMAAIAGGSMLVAFQGVGDALKAVQAADLDPTVENLEKAREAMAALGPDAAKFVTAFQEFRPVLTDIRDGAAAGWFPGLTESLTSFEALAPKVITLFEEIGKAGGDAIADGAASLASDRWTEFFDFLATEAPATITSLGKIIGDLAHGAAEMWMAFQPLNNSFTGWLEDVADGFDDWASSAAGRDDITDFMDYVRETGPAVGDAFGSLIDAFTQITQAAAPLGGPVLRIITVFAEALASIADSPIGTPLFTAIAAMSAFSRASKLMDVASLAASGSLSRMGASAATASKGMSALRGAGQIAAGLLLVAAATRSINDATRDTLPGIDTMMRGLRMGAEEGGASKLSRDFSDLGDSIERLFDKSAGEAFGDTLFTPFEGIFGPTGDTQEALDEIAAIDAALAGLVDSDGPKVAAAALDDLYQSGLLTKEQLALLSANLPEYNNALDRAASAADAAAASTGSLAAQERAAAAAIRAGVEALRAKTQAALGAFDAVTQYRQALKDAKEQGDRNNAGIRGSSDAALANRQALSSLAAAWNNQSDAVKNNGQKYRESRQAFIDTAVAMGVSRAAARALADQILDIPKARAVKISAETAEAEARIANIKRLLSGIDGTRVQTYIDTYRTTINRQVGPAYNAGGIPGSVDGTTVPKTGLPYADRHHYLLADGEEVISNRNGQADRHRGLLKAINAGRLAVGGTAGIDGMVGSTHARTKNPPQSDFFPWIQGLGDAMEDFAFGLDGSARALREAMRGQLAESRVRLNLLEKEKEANKERLDFLRQERQAIEDSIKARFSADPWGQDPGATGYEGAIQKALDANDIEAVNALLAAQQNATAPTASGFADQLKKQIAEAEEYDRLRKTLLRKGFDGAALNSFLMTASIEEVRAMAGSGRGELAKIERLYDQRNQQVQSVASAAGGERFGADIKAQLKENRETNAELRKVTARLAALEKGLSKVEDAAANRGPKKFADAVNGAATNGHKNRRP